MSRFHTEATTAESVYNRSENMEFYTTLWGGQTIHVGKYSDLTLARTPDDVKIAGLKTNWRMWARVMDMGVSNTFARHVVDLGSGIGGSAIWMAIAFGHRVTGINISESQNAIARSRVHSLGLGVSIDIRHADFLSTGLEDESADVVWSQDSFLHCGNRPVLMREIMRILRPGGVLVFSDLMLSSEKSERSSPPMPMQDIYSRLGLADMWSPEMYLRCMHETGMTGCGFALDVPSMECHYRSLAQMLMRNPSMAKSSEESVRSLHQWADMARDGHLSWGILYATKPA